MSLKANFELMADYNQTMNISIYHAVSKLNADKINENQGAFFGSILNTLNHILVGDTIWLQRFSHHQTHFMALDYVRSLDTPKSLDAVLYTDLNELKEHREKVDRVIKEFASELDDDVLSQPLRYKNTHGHTFNKKFSDILQHFFNHQTHHRGQVSTLLYQQGIDVGVTDLLLTIPELD